MNALVVCLFASCFGALSNLFFRKNSDSNASSNGYLTCYFLTTFIFSFLLFPNIFDTPFSLEMTLIGAIAGAFNVLMMLATGKALQNGPSGLTFAFQNVSAVFPGLLLFLIFGKEFGFDFSPLQGVGLFLVTIGLFLGSFKKTGENRPTFRFFSYALLCLALQLFVLSLMHFRTLVFTPDLPEHALIPFTLDANSDVWFMPGQFGASFLIQALLFLSEKRKLNRSEYGYGACGGVANCFSTALLLFSTKLALPIEKTILFPCFAAATILLCNLWAAKLYKEKFNFASNGICSFGIFLASIS